MFQKSIKFLIPFIASLAFLLLFMSNINAGDNTWTTTGPYGVRIYGLAIDPNNTNIIYGATPDGTINVYKSVDGGSTWQPSNDGIPEGAYAVGFVFDPDDSNTVYVATEWGMYKSINAGETWELKSVIEMDGELMTISAWSISISSIDGTLYLGAYNAGFEGWAPGGVYRSRDGGETWEKLGNGAPTLTTVKSIVVAPSAPYIIYAGTYMNAQGVFKSIDGGDSWYTINNGFGSFPDIDCLTVDPFDSQVVYMGTSHDGIYKTIDGGQSWMPIGNGLGSSHITSIIINRHNQQMMYVGGGSNPGTGTPGVYKSLDNSGSSWTSMMDGMGSRAIYSLVIDNNIPQNIYAGTSSGVWKYTLVSAPESYSISINNGSLFTNQTAVTLTLTAPSGTTEMMVSNDGGFGDASWETFTPQKSWEITSIGAYVLPRIVYAKFRTYGQISGLYQDDIILDTTPPTGTVEITGTGRLIPPSSPQFVTTLHSTSTLTHTIYLPFVGKNYRPGFTQVGLILSASDDLSGVGEVLVGGDTDFSGVQWAAYKETANWWIYGDGTTIYVKFRDRAGNESEVYSATASP